MRSRMVPMLVVVLWSLVAGTHAAERLRIGAWNIEWLGVPQNRSGIAKKKAQSADDIATYVLSTKVDVLALEEIGDDDGDSDRRTNSTLDKTVAILGRKTGHPWKYVLFGKKDPNDTNQTTGVLWNTNKMKLVGEPFKIPVNTQDEEFNLWDRTPHAVKFSRGSGKTDLVLIPLHMKSNRGGFRHTSKQRQIEAKRLAAVLATVRETFTDEDLVLLGDTNVLRPTEKVLSIYRDAGFIDLNEDNEPTTWQGDAPFDRIFVADEQPEFDGLTMEIAEPDYLEPREFKERLSDHFMVVTSVRILADDD